jgi:hypothetical protein
MRAMILWPGLVEISVTKDGSTPSVPSLPIRRIWSTGS